MGNILHSDKICTDIAVHLTSEIKSIIYKNKNTSIILNKKQISILIDESTTLSRKITLMVVL